MTEVTDITSTHPEVTPMVDDQTPSFDFLGFSVVQQEEAGIAGGCESIISEWTPRTREEEPNHDSSLKVWAALLQDIDSLYNRSGEKLENISTYLDAVTPYLEQGNHAEIILDGDQVRTARLSGEESTRRWGERDNNTLRVVLSLGGQRSLRQIVQTICRMHGLSESVIPVAREDFNVESMFSDFVDRLGTAPANTPEEVFDWAATHFKEAMGLDPEDYSFRAKVWEEAKDLATGEADLADFQNLLRSIDLQRGIDVLPGSEAPRLGEQHHQLNHSGKGLIQRSQSLSHLDLSNDDTDDDSNDDATRYFENPHLED